ncbi:MAG: nuclear transport factor 2 family protein [Rhodospirillaceae bacterium]|nr:nuclear transport factor 2 family protein [Rhodospirillaceae bacterium]
MRTRRHLIGAALALTLGAALAGGRGAPARAAEADPLALLEGYMAAWNAHDAAKAASFFATDGQFFDVAVGKTYAGPADIQANVIQNYLTAVPDLKWQRQGEPIVDSDGSGIAFQWTLSGTNTGPWSDGTEATGNPFEIRGVTFMRLRDGKIVYEGDYYDALGFYQQLGLIE